MDLRSNPENLTWSDVWPGALILAALLVVSLLTFFGDAVRRATAEGPRLVVLAPEVGGLERESPVWLAGKPAGRVLSLSFLEPGGRAGERVAIEAVLLREAMPYLRADARVTVGASGLLAPSVVKIGPGTAGAPPLSDGDTLWAASRPDMEDFRAMADSVRGALVGARDLVSELRQEVLEGNGSVAGFLADRAVQANLDSSKARFGRISEGWRHGGGAPRLLRDDSLRLVAGQAWEALARLQDSTGVRTLGDSLRATAASVEHLSGTASEIAARIDQAEGTVGRAVKDSALTVGAARTRTLLDSLSVELGANPLAWLRFRLF
jgi:ABC-type transporter Mla subunit MlaD